MSTLRRLAVAFSALLLAVAVALPARAQDAKPEPVCGLSFTDPAGDNNNPDNPQDVDSADGNLDIVAGWFNYDAAKGDQGVTANLRVSDLSQRVSDGATGVVWNFVFDVGEGTRFVRTLIDFSGGPYYEYGTYVPPVGGAALPRYQYDGTTEGKMFEGKDGVISVVVPPAAGAAAGAKLSAPFANASASRQAVPGTVPSPTRGLSTPIDTAPDDGAPGSGGTAFTVGACAAPSTPSAPGTGVKPTQSESTGKRSLPVRILTKSSKALAKGKTLSIKLRASQTVTKLAAQLRRGKSVYGKGKLARLSGNGTLKLKLSRKLAKGKYVLDLAGNDSKGQHRLTAGSVTVK